jgi:hypothetical protein
VERVGHHELFNRDLFVLEVADSGDIPEVLALPCPYFACLLVWDARHVSDETIESVAYKLLRAGCVYICCWGPDCSRVHIYFDIADLDLHPDGTWAISTWHENEPLSEALFFLLQCTGPNDVFFKDCRAAIGITVGKPEWAAEVLAALSAPSDFIARVLASDDE